MSGRSKNFLCRSSTFTKIIPLVEKKKTQLVLRDCWKVFWSSQVMWKCSKLATGKQKNKIIFSFISIARFVFPSEHKKFIQRPLPLLCLCPQCSFHFISANVCCHAARALVENPSLHKFTKPVPFNIIRFRINQHLSVNENPKFTNN